VARANPVWRESDLGIESLVVFQGPQAYISPGWYATKAETGKVVPTWNYAVVHVHGRARAFEGRDELRALVERLTREHERGQATPWSVADAPLAQLDRQTRRQRIDELLARQAEGGLNDAEKGELRTLIAARGAG